MEAVAFAADHTHQVLDPQRRFAKPMVLGDRNVDEFIHAQRVGIHIPSRQNLAVQLGALEFAIVHHEAVRAGLLRRCLNSAARKRSHGGVTRVVAHDDAFRTGLVTQGN